MTTPEPSAAAPEPRYTVEIASNARIPIVRNANGIMICQASTRVGADMIAAGLNQQASVNALEHDYSQALSALRELSAQNALLESALDAALELHADVATLEAATRKGFFTEVCVDSKQGARKFRTFAQAAAWVRAQQATGKE